MRPRREVLAALVDPAVIALAETQGFSGAEQHAIIALIKEQTIRPNSVDHACPSRGADGHARLEWPEFDAGTPSSPSAALPPLWDEVERRPGGDAPWAAWQAYQHRKLYLLIDWLHGLIVTRAEMRASLARYAVLGLTAEITRQNPEITCPVCDRLNNENVLDHPGDVPPFHPGCRCLILAAPSRARPKRKRSS